jgi:hypothetical protein
VAVRIVAVRIVAVALVLGLAGVGCGDPLAEKLEAERPDPNGPAKVVDEDGDLVDAPETTATTAPVAPPGDPTSTTVPDRLVFTQQVVAICEEIFAPHRGGPPDDPAAAVGYVRGLQDAYRAWADRMETLTPPDRQVEANLFEGLRRFRRATELYTPALDAALAGDIDEVRAKLWSAIMAMDGAARALMVASVPLSCFPR